jgi:5-methylcytosine-specific restriction protein A
MAWARTSRQSRGYGAAHDKMRAHLMATVILCEECTRQGRTTIGTIADHRVAKAKGGTDERTNYQLLCVGCHRVKSLTERGKAAKPKQTIGIDGWPV